MSVWYSLLHRLTDTTNRHIMSKAYHAFVIVLYGLLCCSLSYACVVYEPGLEGPIIGIDLGETSLRVAVWRNESTVEVISNIDGRTTVFPISDEHEEHQAEPEQGIHHVLLGWVRKTFLGQPRPSPPSAAELWERRLTATLKKAKEAAEAHLGTPVTKAVVSCSQLVDRDAVRRASNSSGLEMVRFISPQTATINAAGLLHHKGEINVVVVHVGETALAADVIAVDDGILETLSSRVQSFGGRDMDKRLLDHLSDELEARGTLRRDQEVEWLEHLKKMREALSFKNITSFSLPLSNGDIVVREMNRSELEGIMSDIYPRLLTLLDRVMNDSWISMMHISHVVLEGGLSRMPLIRSTVSSFFEESQVVIHTFAEPDELVVRGAALYGHDLTFPQRSIYLCNVIPFSFGVETADGLVEPLIPSNTIPPRRVTKTFITSINQTSATVKVMQGMRPLPQHSHLMAQLELRNLTLDSSGRASMEITFDIDVNGIFTVTAGQRQNCKDADVCELGQVESTVVNYRFYSEEVEVQLWHESWLHREEDEAYVARIQNLRTKTIDSIHDQKPPPVPLPWLPSQCDVPS